MQKIKQIKSVLKKIVASSYLDIDGNDAFPDQPDDEELYRQHITQNDRVMFNNWIWIVDKVYVNRFNQEVCDLYMPGDPEVTETEIKVQDVQFKEHDEELDAQSKLNKQSKTNEDIIRMFLEDSYPHSPEEGKQMGFKRWLPSYGTENLKITQINDKWALVNYATPLVINNNGTFLFNTTKYSKSTSKIQNYIKRVAQELGVDLQETSGGGRGSDAMNTMSNIKKIKSELTNETPRLISIIGKRWFDRVNGNTYFSSEIYFDGDLIHKIPMEYGYDEQYIDSSFNWIIKNNPNLPPLESKYERYFNYSERTGIKIMTSVSDVSRKKDMMAIRKIKAEMSNEEYPSKEKLKQIFPNLSDADFSEHATDLYIRYSPDVFNWLKKNHPYPNMITTFNSDDNTGKWIEIPFALIDEKYNKMSMIKKIKSELKNSEWKKVEPKEKKPKGTYDHNNPEHYKKRKKEEADEKDKSDKYWDDWVKTND